MPRLTAAALGALLWLSPGFAHASKKYDKDEISSSDWKQAIEVYRKNLDEATTKRADELKLRDGEIKKTEDEIVDLEKREEKLKTEIDDDSDHSHDGLREAHNVIENTLFRRRFELKKLQRKYHEETEPLLDSYDKKIIAIREQITNAEQELQKALAREKKLAQEEAARLAKKRAQEEAARLAKLKKRSAGPAVILKKGVEPAKAAPPPPPAPKPWEPQPPPGLHCPAAPKMLDADTTAYFAADWQPACWYTYSHVTDRIDLPQALRISAALAERSASAVPSAPKHDPNSDEPPPPPPPEKRTAKALSDAEAVCRVGPIPYLTREFGSVSYEVYDKAGKGDLAQPVWKDAWRIMRDRLTRSYALAMWARYPGCEFTCGRFWESRPKADLAKFDEWQAANRVPTLELQKTVNKLVDENKGNHPNIPLYDRILKEREMGATPGLKPVALPAPGPEKTQPKTAPPPATTPHVPAAP